MAKLIDVPGQGLLEFPDEMDDVAIKEAIDRNFFPEKLASSQQVQALQDNRPGGSLDLTGTRGLVEDVRVNPQAPERDATGQSVTTSGLLHYPYSVARGFNEALGSGFKGLAGAITQKEQPTYFNEPARKQEDINKLREARGLPTIAAPTTYEERLKATPAWQIGQGLQELNKQAPLDATRETNLATKTLEGLGSSLALGAGSALASVAAPTAVSQSSAALLGGMLSGMVTNAGQHLEAGIKQGVPAEQLTIPYLLGAANGATEIAPIEVIFQQLKNLAGKTLWGKIATVAGIGALAEGLQEATQSVLDNVIARQTYDPTQNPWEGVLDSGLAGAIIGALGGTGGALLQNRAARKAATAGKITLEDLVPTTEQGQVQEQPTEEINDVAWQRFLDTYGSPEAKARARQSEIERVWLIQKKVR